MRDVWSMRGRHGHANRMRAGKLADRRVTRLRSQRRMAEVAECRQRNLTASPYLGLPPSLALPCFAKYRLTDVHKNAVIRKYLYVLSRVRHRGGTLARRFG
jgi:hypothetical protein